MTSTVLSEPVAKISTGKHAPVERMTSEITRLTELPESWYAPAPNERGGYQYRTQTLIFGKYVETLLDGCAGSNNVTEEMIVGMINMAYREGIKSTDPRYPIVQLERWPLQEVVTGIAAGHPVPLAGGVILRVHFVEGRGADPSKWKKRARHRGQV